MSFDQWLAFVVVWTLAGLSLGPNALNCIAVSAGIGFRRSLWSVVGILLASLCHKAAVIFGIAAILLANGEWFSILKLSGAAYLIWMGIVMWRKGDGLPDVSQPKASAPIHLVRRSFLISMSNPKAIIAYLAVFSQFLSPEILLFGQLVVLVPTALVITVAIFVGYCGLGRGVGRFLRSARRRLAFNRMIGTTYIFAGMALAASGNYAGSGQRP